MVQKALDDEIHQLMIALIILLLLLGIIGSVTCFYQLKKLRSLRIEPIKDAEPHIREQRNCVRALKKMAHDTRKNMHQNVAQEVEELRAFQREVSEQLGSMKEALAKLSAKRFVAHGAIGSKNYCDSSLEDNNNMVKGRIKME